MVREEGVCFIKRRMLQVYSLDFGNVTTQCSCTLNLTVSPCKLTVYFVNADVSFHPSCSCERAVSRPASAVQSASLDICRVVELTAIFIDVVLPRLLSRFGVQDQLTILISR